MEKLWFQPIYRYPNVFEWVRDRQSLTDTEKVLLHFICRRISRAARYQYARMTDYKIYLKRQEILSGMYGQQAAICFGAFDENKQILTAWYMLRQEIQGESILLYGKVLTSVLGDGVLYRSRYHSGELLFYIGLKPGKKDLQTIELINLFFLPFPYKVRVFWDHPFGMMGESFCSNLDDMCLY